MIYDFHNKLTYVLSFFIAFRPFPGLPLIPVLSFAEMHKKRWNSWINVHCFLMSCRDDFNKSHSWIKQRPVEVFWVMTSFLGLTRSVTKLAKLVQRESTSLTFLLKIIWYNTWKSVAWRASRTPRRKSTRKMWLHSIDFSVVLLFNKSFNSSSKKASKFALDIIKHCEYLLINRYYLRLRFLSFREFFAGTEKSGEKVILSEIIQTKIFILQNPAFFFRSLHLRYT